MCIFARCSIHSILIDPESKSKNGGISILDAIYILEGAEAGDVYSTVVCHRLSHSGDHAGFVGGLREEGV